MPWSAAPATAEEAYRVLLSIGEVYFAGGVEPRVDGPAFIAAWPALLSYLQAHREALLLSGVVEAELSAGSRLCRELAESLGELSVTPPLPVVLHRATIEAAIAKLERMRAAVRGPGSALGPRALAQFGVQVPLDPSRPAQVAAAITQFLAGAGQHLERLHLFRLVGADIEELKAHRRALLALSAAAGRGEPVGARADRLVGALAGLYASLATAIAQAFPPGDRRRDEGLGRIPTGVTGKD